LPGNVGDEPRRFNGTVAAPASGHTLRTTNMSEHEFPAGMGLYNQYVRV
jgi:hypothetical protein